MLLNHCRLYAPLSGGFAGENCCVELDGGKSRQWVPPVPTQRMIMTAVGVHYCQV